MFVKCEKNLIILFMVFNEFLKSGKRDKNVLIVAELYIVYRSEYLTK